MRFLFSAVPAHGHILPLVPLMEAAAEAGHSVALLTAGAIQHDIAPELPPGVLFLAAGSMPGEFSADAARRTGADVFHPTPAVIGEIFGGSRLDLGGAESVARARAFAPDLVIAEAFDAVGPLLAAHLGVPWHQAGLGPALPTVIREAITGVARTRHEEAGVRVTEAESYLDPCPPLLQDPEFHSTLPVRPVRVRAHRRTKGSASLPAFHAPDKPTVLVTLGTIFSDPAVLASVVDAVAGHDVNVLATLGSALTLDDDTAPEHGRAAPADGVRPSGAEVRHVPFVPLDELLATADVVVAAGGAGTVLGALARGVPMVLWPQGADQPLNAGRAAASGTAINVGCAEAVALVLPRLLEPDSSYHRRAREAATEIARRPDWAQVVEDLTSEAAKADAGH
ncbi:glycosyltransferase [Streptomyces sp. NPDC005263]|uniref:glycosyltransferase n=1 Tax=Streptomyces sp. NPDC005263 TaxID=3364711 RepID=UPI00367A4703